ncbi:MAG: hypothetical protein ABIP75_13590 [Pyrinomonadaceae bacterium]
MLGRLFPKTVDNRFRGYRVALWLYVLLVFSKIGTALLHILSPDGGAQSISTIPLNAYPAGAAQNIIALFARMGMVQLLLGSVFVVVLLRYRALIPLMYGLMVLSYLGDRMAGYFKPLVLGGISGAAAPAMLFMAATVLGLVLSLTGRGYDFGQPSAAPPMPQK